MDEFVFWSMSFGIINFVINGGYGLWAWWLSIFQKFNQDLIEIRPWHYFYLQDESFLEDINMILNTGDIPNLYDNEERLEIIEKVE